MPDHLARLCLDGTASTGYYTPHGFNVALRGAELSVDHMVYLHEVQHCALNDETAWGSALHVYARLPGSADTFSALLDVCRLTHETFATYSSVRIAAARPGDIGEILAAYPDYRRPYADAELLVSQVEGANRRLLVLTALARLCMQTPVIAEILRVGPGAFTVAALRERDRPDTRWAWFLDRGPAALAEAARVGDGFLRAAFDGAALRSDDGDLYASTDRDHDEAWEVWEIAVYDHLAAALGDTGARTLGVFDHRQAAADLLARVTDEYGELGLRDSMSEAQRRDDQAVASAVLQQVRHSFSGDRPHRAVLLPPMDLEPLIARAAVVVDARPADRLAALYRWPPATRLPPGPVVAVRAFVDDGGEGEALGHLMVTEPDQLAALAERCAGRTPFAVCVSASCFADTAWTQRWLTALLAQPLFVLVDIEPDRFVPAWARDEREVLVVGVDVDDTGGARTALLCTPDDGAMWWLTLGNDVTVRLMAGYLSGVLGARLHTDADRFAAIRPAALAVIASLLATESFVSFDALGAPDG